MNGEPIKGFWGQCDTDVGQKECEPNWEKPIMPEPSASSEPRGELNSLAK